MAIAQKVQDYLSTRDVAFETIEHAATDSASRSAQASHVRGDNLAKGVVLHDGERYLLAVVPSTHRVELETLGDMMGCRFTLAGEGETAKLFDDCALGADPPLGQPYGMPVAVDEAVFERDEVCFEGGDHKTLVKVSTVDFARLHDGARRGSFSHHM